MYAECVSKGTSSDGALRILIIDHHDSYTLNLLISLSEATSRQSHSPPTRTSSSSSSEEEEEIDALSRTVILPHNHELLSTPEIFKKTLLPHFDALILGPGPGHPCNERDFGPAGRILRSILDGDIIIPVLGVCLGHQGLAVACGGKVIQANSLRHGLSSQVKFTSLTTSSSQEPQWPSLFGKLQSSTRDGESSMIRYNSLTVDEATLPPSLIVTAYSQEVGSSAPSPRWNPYCPTKDAGPSKLASYCSSSSPFSSERVVMALQHRDLPLWSVQFHFESISSHNGALILERFLTNCKTFWDDKGSSSRRLQRQADIPNPQGIESQERSSHLPPWVRNLGQSLVACSTPNRLPFREKRKHLKVVSKRIAGVVLLGYEQAGRVFNELFRSGSGSDSAVWLDSARSGDAQSRYSYMARPSWRLAYQQAKRRVDVYGPEEQSKAPLASFDLEPCFKSVVQIHGLPTPKASRSTSPDDRVKEADCDMWSWLSEVQQSLQSCTEVEEGDTICPFKSGFVGCFDYEMRGESLIRGKDSKRRRSAPQTNYAPGGLPSAWFGFCDKILAYDHESNEWAVLYLEKIDEGTLQGSAASKLQSALNLNKLSIGITQTDGQEWAFIVQNQLEAISGSTHPPAPNHSHLPPLTPVDSAAEYKDKIEAARAYIGAGESYELCVTTQFKGRRIMEDVASSSFDLYIHLRRKNPAPFSAYLHLGQGQSILSTSPERFMSIEAGGQVEMRPIKGTLARAGYKVGEESIRKAKEAGDAASILWCEEEDERRRRALHADAKEVAENLMIVDLIRADLLSFCPPATVKVPSLMKVESYESVHQLVTTIIGDKDDRVSSVEALKRCFPPGSMTGAPKVRSVDLLERLEQRERGVYSGILGWIGVDGAANTSVVIRTVTVNGQEVSVGAGGAITYLSEAEREWEEVLDKVKAIATVLT